MRKIDCSKTINFFKEKRRMCDSMISTDINTCGDCKLIYHCAMNEFLADPDTAIAIVQKWSDEHPEQKEKTLAEDFFEKFPRAMRKNTFYGDTPFMPACNVYKFPNVENSLGCFEGCCAECWIKPLKEVVEDVR